VGGDVTAKISHWSLTAQARVKSQASLYGICSGRTGTKAGLSQSLVVFPSPIPRTLCISVLKPGYLNKSWNEYGVKIMKHREEFQITL
jgi:hypothetical protein